MINPGQLFQIKSMIDTFVRTHPKFPMFCKVVYEEALQEGSIIDIKVTTKDGREINTNLKLTESDLELFRSLKDIKPI